jgi:hypothetical protein
LKHKKKILDNCDFLNGLANNQINRFYLKYRKMKDLKIYAFLAFLFFGSTSVSAQSMLDLYFGGNKDSLANEAAKLIHIPEPTFKPTGKQTEPNPALISDMGFEQVYKSENHFFAVRDNKKIFAHRFAKQSDVTIHPSVRARLIF